jgi:hypothetical protein
MGSCHRGYPPDPILPAGHQGSFTREGIYQERMRMVQVKGMKICPAIAKISPAQLRKVTALESELGLILVAHDRMPKVASLSKEELASVQALEKKTGTVLVAYRD